MNPLTDRQQQVLEFIRGMVEAHGVPPTLRDIAAHFGFRSVKAAADHVAALRRKGVVGGEPHRARALQVLVSPEAASGSGSRLGSFGAGSEKGPTFGRGLGRALVRIPIYGAIPAGLAEDRHQESRGCVAVDLATLGIRPTARTFALEVRGDSMVGRHIVDGDLVVLEHGRTPRSGDVVAALIDNESTLKTFVQERGKAPYLKAENPKYPQLHPAAELVVQGVMIGLIRKVRA